MCFSLNIFNLCVSSSSNNSSQSKQAITSTSTHTKTSRKNHTNNKKIKVVIKNEVNIKNKQALSPALSLSTSSSFASSIPTNKEKQKKNLKNKSKNRLFEKPSENFTSWHKKFRIFSKGKSSKNKYQFEKVENLKETSEIENKEDHRLRNSQRPDKKSDTKLLLLAENNSERATSNLIEHQELTQEHQQQSNRNNQILKSYTAYSFNSATSLSPLTPPLQKSPLVSISSSLNQNSEFNFQNEQNSSDKQSTSSSSSHLSNHSYSHSFNMETNKKTLNEQENNQSRTNENVSLFMPTTDKNQNNKISKQQDDEARNLPFLFASPKLKRQDLANTIGLDSAMKNQLSLKTNEIPALRLETLQTKKQAFYFNDNKLFSKPNELLREDTQLSSILDEEINSARLDIDPSKHKAHKNQHHDYKYYQNQHYHNRHGHSKIFSKGGKLTISPEQVYEFNESDFEEIRQIGNGEFGTVHKVLHKPSQTFMALKRVGPTVGSQFERKKVLKELDFVLECEHHENIVIFYGVKLNNEPADCLICMELMDTSLEKFYKFVYLQKQEEIPEAILGKIVVATINGLNYLKETHKIIHRDVKPSNILINQQGKIKICDFGISGKLVDSIAASRDAGCQLYMAPERIDPTRAAHFGYDVRSDVWSLGITLYELATGKFPYPQWKTIFHQLNLVVEQDAPRLESERLSLDFKDFVNTCLTKDDTKRPKYRELMQHKLVETHLRSDANCADYFKPYILEMDTLN